MSYSVLSAYLCDYGCRNPQLWHHILGPIGCRNFCSPRVVISIMIVLISNIELFAKLMYCTCIQHCKVSSCSDRCILFNSWAASWTQLLYLVSRAILSWIHTLHKHWGQTRQVNHRPLFCKDTVRIVTIVQPP